MKIAEQRNIEAPNRSCLIISSFNSNSKNSLVGPIIIFFSAKLEPFNEITLVNAYSMWQLFCFNIRFLSSTHNLNFKVQWWGSTSRGYPSSVTSKKSPNVYNSCPKMVSLAKLTISTTLQKLPKNVGDLCKLIAGEVFEKLPKVQ